MTRPSPSPFPRIPDHEILKRIGRGSYGEVWLARTVLGTLRAVKTVRRESFSSSRPYEREFAGIQRFEPVSRAHDGLIDILQVGRNDAEGFFYYVMELADCDPRAGSETRGDDGYAPWTFSELLETAGPLDLAECVRLFHGLAMGLSHLHRAGLVHRDIKPANIVFVGGIAKFADLGLVSAADESLSYVGTEGYIPPEGAGTVAADLFSLGKVIYEAATGKDRTEFPSLPVESGALRNAAALLELNAIWLKACAPSPTDRYASADELAADLALLQAGRSVKRLRGVERRFRQARHVAVGVGVLACVAGLIGGFENNRARFERNVRLQSEELRRRAESAEREAQRRLEESRLAEARAMLQTRQIGRRSAVLSLLGRVKDPGLRPQARSLAATALVLPDLEPTGKPAEAGDDPVAEAAPDGSISIRGRSGGELLGTLPSLGETARPPLQVTSDRRFVYAGYGKYVERIWDVSSRRVVARLDTNYYELAFRPRRPEVAVAYVDSTVRLHALPDWGVLREWEVGPSEKHLRWSPEGGRLLVYSADGEVHRADADSGAVVRMGRLPTQLQIATWHPDGSRIALCGGDGYVRVRSFEGWADDVVLSRHEAQFVDARFLPPFPWILTSSWDGTSRLWDWQAGCELGRYEATGYGLGFDPDRRWVDWRLGSDPTTTRWKLTGTEAHREIDYGDPRTVGGPFMVSWSGDSRWIAGPDQDGTRIWRVADGTLAAFVPGGAEAAWLSEDGSELAVNAAGEIRRWKLTLASSGHGTAEPIESVASSYVEGKLAVDAGGAVLAWIDGPRIEMRVRGRRVSWEHGQELPETVAMSSDGATVAVGTRNHAGARVFDVASGRLLWSTDVRYGTHLEFSRDGRWLAVGTDSGCRLYDARTGALRWHHAPARGEDPSFWEVAFSPDGALLAWTPNPSRVRLLSAVTGVEILTLDYPTRRYITRLGFSPDGTWLAESSNKHVLHLWNVRELRRLLREADLDW